MRVNVAIFVLEAIIKEKIGQIKELKGIEKEENIDLTTRKMLIFQEMEELRKALREEVSGGIR